MEVEVSWNIFHLADLKAYSKRDEFSKASKNIKQDDLQDMVSRVSVTYHEKESTLDMECTHAKNKDFSFTNGS